MNTNQPQNASPVPQYQMPYDRFKKVRRTTSFTRFDFIFAVIFLITSILSFNFSCFGGFNLGFTVSGVMLCAYAVIYNMPKGFSATGTFFAFCGAVISATCFIYDEALKGFAVLIFWAFVGLALYFCSNPKTAAGEKTMVLQTAEFMIVSPFAHLPLMFNSVSDAAKEKQSTKLVMPVFIGIACAVPALLIIVPLLVSGDAAFEGLISKSIFANFGELICSIIFGVVIAILGFSAIFAAKKDKCFNENAATGNGGIPLLAVNGFLGALSAVYILYLFSQIDYFAGGLMGFLPKEFQVADYARRGFFEMSVICAFNLAFILIGCIFSKRRQGKGLTALKVFSVFICAFSMFLISSVAAKLVLYMKSFAITRLRFITTVFCIILAIVFICLIVKLFAKKFPCFRVAASVVAAIILVVSCVGIDGFIAGYNYNVYASGTQKTMDVAYLSRLGKSSVPYLVKLLDDKDEKVASQAACALVYQYTEYGENESAAKAAACVYDFNASAEVDLPENIETADDEEDQITQELADEYLKDVYYPKISGELTPRSQEDFRSFNITENNAAKVYRDNWNKIVERYNELVANK